jgi:hypothetical protein
MQPDPQAIVEDGKVERLSKEAEGARADGDDDMPDVADGKEGDADGAGKEGDAEEVRRGCKWCAVCFQTCLPATASERTSWVHTTACLTDVPSRQVQHSVSSIHQPKSMQVAATLTANR